MNFSYKIENYYPYESRIFVIYTPTDPTFETLGAWVGVTADMTETQILEAVVAQAPLYKWEMPKLPSTINLTGLQGSGVILPPAPFVAPPLTPAQIQAEIVEDVQGRLDAFAQTRGYDSILSACSYVTSTVPKFATEAQYCVESRDATWGALYAGLAEVLAGTRPMPTSIADVLPFLPALEWPL